MILPIKRSKLEASRVFSFCSEKFQREKMEKNWKGSNWPLLVFPGLNNDLDHLSQIFYILHFLDGWYELLCSLILVFCCKELFISICRRSIYSTSTIQGLWTFKVTEVNYFNMLDKPASVAVEHSDWTSDVEWRHGSMKVVVTTHLLLQPGWFWRLQQTFPFFGPIDWCFNWNYLGPEGESIYYFVTQLLLLPQQRRIRLWNNEIGPRTNRASAKNQYFQVYLRLIVREGGKCQLTNLFVQRKWRQVHFTETS